MGRDEEEVTEPSMAAEVVGGILSGFALSRHKPLLETLPTVPEPWARLGGVITNLTQVSWVG